MRHILVSLLIATSGFGVTQTIALTEVVKDISAAHQEVFVQMPIVNQEGVAGALHQHISNGRLQLGDVTVRGLVSPAAATHPEDYTGSLVRNGATFKFARLSTPMIIIDARLMYRGAGLIDGVSPIERIDGSSLPAEQRNRSVEVFNRAQAYQPEWSQP